MNRLQSRSARRVASGLFGILGTMALASCSDASDRGSLDPGSTEAQEEALSAESAAARGELDRIREIEDHRLLESAELRRFLQSTNPRVAEAAATAAGRIGDTTLTAHVLALLDARSSRVRAAAALALGLLGGDGVEGAIVARLGKERDRGARAQLLLALGRKGTASSLPAITAPIVQNDDAEVQGAAAEALGFLIRSGVAFGKNDAAVERLLAHAGSHPSERATPSAFALSGLAGQKVPLPEAALLSAFASSPSPTARAYLGRALSVLKTPAAIQALVREVARDRDPHARAGLCGHLARVGATPEVLGALSSALRDRSPEVVVAAVTAIGTLGAAASGLAPALTALYDGSRSDWVRSTVLTTLVAVDKGAARSRVEAGLSDAWPVRLTAIPALAVLGTDADVAKLVSIAGGADKRLVYAAIEAIATLDPSRATPEMKATLRGVLANPDFETISAVADAVVAHKWTDFADDFRGLYDAFPGPANLNGRMAVLLALGTVGSTADVPLFERGLADDEQLVSQTAADAYKAITGVDVSARVRRASVVRTKTPSHREVERALDSLVLLETTRGPIVLRMLREAPLSATNFVRLAGSGFYDGLPFHRVVPNFVAQGGDPRGDGFGGSDDLVREEIARVPHRRGTVGMATQGKDTASSQFFFNHGWNVSLDGRYTVFAETIFGLDAADRLEVGDTIKRARVLPGAGL
ncbi:peptidylprolyl isomerase [Pendulispora albinea]|uniref:peptidylprolyl isomerase n=1 Tax=Pendulispora albinea TaxID=2741071 RepID=A0ABZ2LYD5_9BACT